MKNILGCLLVVTAGVALGSDATLDFWQAFNARYTIFSGPTLADSDAPTQTDRKLAILVKGPAAKEIFDSIGPDAVQVCSQEKGDRERAKEGVQCTYTAGGKNKGYNCWIGINLRTGKSVVTVSC